MGAFFAMLEAAIELLPEGSDLAVFDSLPAVFQSMRAFDVGLPITETLDWTVGYISVLGGVLGVRMILMVYKLLPFT